MNFAKFSRTPPSSEHFECLLLHLAWVFLGPGINKTFTKRSLDFAVSCFQQQHVCTKVITSTKTAIYRCSNAKVFWKYAVNKQENPPALPALTGDRSYFRKSNLLHTTMRKDVNNIFIEREFQIIFWSSCYVSSITTKK